jgi:hypothetical protein
MAATRVGMSRAPFRRSSAFCALGHGVGESRLSRRNFSARLTSLFVQRVRLILRRGIDATVTLVLCLFATAAGAFAQDKPAAAPSQRPPKTATAMPQGSALVAFDKKSLRVPQGRPAPLGRENPKRITPSSPRIRSAASARLWDTSPTHSTIFVPGCSARKIPPRRSKRPKLRRPI